MRYNTHIVTSLCGGVGLCTLTDTPLSVVYIGGVVLGSLLPDIDEPKSYVGRRTAGATHATKFLFGHRGMTHSLLASLLVALLYLVFPNPFVAGVVVGYVFHIVGDMFSVSGVPLLLPFSKKKIAIPLYVTGGFRETLIYVGALFLLLYLSKWEVVPLLTFFILLYFAQAFGKRLKRKLHLF